MDELLLQLAAVIVFGDRGGGLGTGCLHELVDAWWRGIQVAMLDDYGACRHVAALRSSLREPDLPTDRHLDSGGRNTRTAC
jgi:hypothetical protein